MCPNLNFAGTDMKKIFILLLTTFFLSNIIWAEDGYRLWLRYDKISDSKLLAEYQELVKGVMVAGNSPVLEIVKEELELGLAGLLNTSPEYLTKIENDGVLLIGRGEELEKIFPGIKSELKPTGVEGYRIFSSTIEEKDVIVITADEYIGLLYGTFHFLRLLQTNECIKKISIESAPKVQVRILNHWDNLDRTSERGYAGFSIWDWHRLPDYIIPQYKDYARANASIGINGTVLTNVNSNAHVLTEYYLTKVKALADLFRPYGIKVYLTARFSAPMEIGRMKTADPLDEEVQKWWNEKVKEIYSLIPDFGGFLVKANSEGQPGPQDYGRTHADGANMLARALEPFGGIVMWRAFVYSADDKDDRAKQAYKEFKPLDGKFRKNVLLQLKNGAIDFQPREPFHPMFGAFPETPLMPELQITQEYLGQATHLVYLAPLFKECLDSDTYAKGEGSSVAKIIDGSLHNYQYTAMAGVANIGTDRNWTGHLFGQSNWYAFGRLAWNHELSSEAIADEWLKMTFTNDENFVNSLKSVMMDSRENTVNYMTPLGLHHIMGWDHHYGPAPWIKDKNRDDWTSVYYHKANNNGIGFNRTSTGSDALSQYFPEVAKRFENLETCPEEFLLWFHHVPWDYKTKSDKTLWDELVTRYYQGTEAVFEMQKVWDEQKGKIDDERFEQVKMLLKIQGDEAKWWRDACVIYFQTFSGKPIPDGFEKPEKSLEYFMNLRFPCAPGIKPQW